ncbi:hypothetical protein J1N35_016634 [Gossypium stocksii]|uniref:Uncharacterized protein n=1 Tax=Gossypium stocksii TaxID=47602 RepID=A0A9D4A3A8_9ROSI|nr:hypothetical protein J1N35_016634 [Gossypium stocksii]
MLRSKTDVGLRYIGLNPSETSFFPQSRTEPARPLALESAKTANSGGEKQSLLAKETSDPSHLPHISLVFVSVL